MANNRLYLVVPSPEGDEPKRVLLAKGWCNGWDVWKPEDLIARLNSALEGADIGASTGGSKTCIYIEDENMQVERDTAEREELEKLLGKPSQCL